MASLYSPFVHYNHTCWVCPPRQDEIPAISHLRPEEDMWPRPSCIPYTIPSGLRTCAAFHIQFSISQWRQLSPTLL